MKAENGKPKTGNGEVEIMTDLRKGDCLELMKSISEQQRRKNDCVKYKRCAVWRNWFSARWKEESGTISEVIKNAKSIMDN